MQHISNSAAKRMQRPPLAELSERPTPRKLSSSQSPVSSRQAPSQRTPRRSKSPRKLAIRAMPVRLEKQRAEQRALSDGGMPDNVQKRAPVNRRRVTVGREESFNIIPIAVPVQPSTTPRKMVAGRSPLKRHVQSEYPGSDVASSIASGPRKLNQVNGIVRQLNGVSDGSASSRPPSLAGTSEVPNRRAPPPKLKRKAPG